MNLGMTTIFTYTDVSSIGTGLTVDDTVCDLRLHRRRLVFFKISGIESQKDILYRWFIQELHLLPCQKD